MATVYIRCSSDCCLFRRNEAFEKYGTCTALHEDAFTEYVHLGKCGTYECPFYKKDENSIRIGNTEVKK